MNAAAYLKLFANLDIRRKYVGWYWPYVHQIKKNNNNNNDLFTKTT